VKVVEDGIESVVVEISRDINSCVRCFCLLVVNEVRYCVHRDLSVGLGWNVVNNVLGYFWNLAWKVKWSIILSSSPSSFSIAE